MPIYEYRCKSCGHELEKLQRMSDDPLVDCPACGEGALTKLISPVGFRLKGSGWYETDFKRDNRRNVAESGAETKGETKSGDGASSSGEAAGKTGGKDNGGGSKGSTGASTGAGSGGASKPAGGGSEARAG